MEELKSLEELNEEYKELKGEVETLKNSFNEKEDGFKSIESENTRLNSVYKDAKMAYEKAKKVLDMMEENNKDENGNDILDLSVNRQQVENLERKMNDAEQDKNDYNDKVYKPQKTEFETFKKNAKDKSNRMKIILASFAVNEKINSSLKNELEMEFEEKIEEQINVKDKGEGLRKKINEDLNLGSTLRVLNGNLKALDKLNEEIRNGRPTVEQLRRLGNLGQEIDRLTNLAKIDMMKIYESDESNNSLDLKDAILNMSEQEINKMAETMDSKDGILVSILDKKDKEIEKVIQCLKQEEKDKIDTLESVKEMVQNGDSKSENESELIREINRLEQEERQARLTKGEAEKELARLKISIEQTNATLSEQKPNTENRELIERLEKELKEIQNEEIEYIENDEITKLSRRKQELEVERDSYESIESNEHKNARLEFEKAEKALEKEEKNPSILDAKDDDKIIVNPEYKKFEDMKEAVQSSVINRNPEIKGLKEQRDELSKKIELDEKNISSEQTDNDALFSDIAESYVGEETCPKFVNALKEGKEDDVIVIAFDEYRTAELELRQAMLKLKQNPTKAQLSELDKAYKKYNTSSNKLRNMIMEIDNETYDKFYDSELSIEAIHKYLDNALQAELDSGKDLDDAYNNAIMKNRINELKKNGTLLDEEQISDLENSYEKLDEILKAMLLGNQAIKTGEIDSFRKICEDVIKDENYKKISDILEGKGLPENTKKKNLFQRAISIFSRNKKLKEYDFDKNEKPEELKTYNENKEKIKNKREQLTKDNTKLKEIKELLTKKFEEELTTLEQKDLVDANEGLKELKQKGIPREINKTKLESLKKLKEDAEQKMKQIPFGRSAKGLDAIKAEIGQIEKKLKTMPVKIAANPNAEKDKAKRIEEKNKEIEDAKKNHSQSTVNNELINKLNQLIEKQKGETKKLEDADKEINRIAKVLLDKRTKLEVLQEAKKLVIGMKNLIQIKNAGKFGYRKSGPIAEELAKDAKNAKKEDFELEQ